jgi:phosphate transport system protein
MDGTRREFDRTLGGIEAKVIELFAMVAEDLPAATRVLLGADPETALAERELAIDALYRQVEELAGQQILMQAPVASDLRFLLSVLRIAPELERSHDLVMQIATQADHPAGEGLSPDARSLVERMGRLAAAMWRDAADAWYSRDRAAAAALTGHDQEMDQLHASLTAELVSGTMTIPVTMEITLVARCYERLAAHAVNIARRVAYLAGSAAG